MTQASASSPVNRVRTPLHDCKIGFVVVAGIAIAGGVAWAEQQAWCPTVIHSGSETWTQVGTGWEVEFCWWIPLPLGGQVKTCTTSEWNRYMNEQGQVRDYNCTSGSWS